MKSLRKDTRNYFIEVLSQANCITFVSDKAENWSQAVEGTLQFRKKNNLRGEKTAFGYCVLPNRFIFIEYETKIEPMLREMKDYPNIDAASPLQFLFKFMEYLLEDDMIFCKDMKIIWRISRMNC